MCKTIKQKVKFRAAPADVYEQLVTATDEIGGRFTLGAGSGIVVDMAPPRRVVRAWREPDYPEGVFSMAAVTLRPVDTGTELTLTHRGVPKALIPRTEERWRRDYWDPMRARLNGTGRAVAGGRRRVMAGPTAPGRTPAGARPLRRPSAAG